MSCSRHATVSAAVAALLGAGSLLAAPNASAQSPDPPAEKKAAKAPAEEIPDAPQMTRYPPSSVRLPLILGGTFITGAAYGLTVASALTWDDVPGADAMLIPVVGPWVALGQNDCAPDDPDCGAILWVRGILLVIDGIAQLGGLGLIAEGIFMTTESEAPAAPANKAPKTSWTLAPMITPTQTGVGVVGTF